MTHEGIVARDLTEIGLGTTFEWQPQISLPGAPDLRSELERIQTSILNDVVEPALSLWPMDEADLGRRLETLRESARAFLKSAGQIVRRYLESPEEIRLEVARAYCEGQRKICLSVPSVLEPTSAVALQVMVDACLEICLGPLLHPPRLIQDQPKPGAEDLDRELGKLLLGMTIGLACVFSPPKSLDRSRLKAIIQWGKDAAASAVRLGYELGITDGKTLQAVVPELRDGVPAILDAFATRVARIAEVEAVSYSTEGAVQRVWTFVLQRDKSIRRQVYQEELHLLTKYPETPFDFNIVTLHQDDDRPPSPGDLPGRIVLYRGFRPHVPGS